MSRERLNLAVAEGWVPAQGRILCVGIRAADLPDGIDRDRLTVVSRLKPEVEALEAAGIATASEVEGTFAAAIVGADRVRDLSQDRIARARAAVPDGPLLIDGAKTDGIESLLTALRKRGPVGDVISKAHGKIFVVPAGEFADWRAGPSRNADGYLTAPGVFSADRVDRGSALLAEVLPADMSGTAGDLGAGWGYLSAQALSRAPGLAACHLVEADRVALDCARVNAADPRARFHWADALRWVSPVALDHVLCNPPFHASRRPDPALGRGFLAAAARNLGPAGRLWLVANRHLPYEAVLSELFGQVTEIGGDPAFKLILAERPRGVRRPGDRKERP